MIPLNRNSTTTYLRCDRMIGQRSSVFIDCPHLYGKLEAMIENDLVVMERENLGKHIRGLLEQLRLE